MTARALLASVAILAALALGACGSDSSASGDPGGELTVSAAASLTDAFPAYGETLPGEERFSFAGSDELAAQIRQGAKPDVFASANTTYPDELHDQGLVGKPVVFTRNRLVIAVPAQGSQIHSIDDLAEPGLDLVIGAKGVPVGDYTREVIDGLPRAEADAILANVRSEESDVKGVVGKVGQGAADAGFVYASDVAAAGDELGEVTLPRKLEPQVSYAIAAVEGAEEPERAKEFVDGLLDPEGQQILQDSGFLPLH
jgi:molybdate transport system substrate-binding protein